VDGVKVVDNDGSAQSATSKCSSVILDIGVHTMYIEGWSQSSKLSMSTAYQGPDTNSMLIPIQAVASPDAPSLSYPTFNECDPKKSGNIKTGQDAFTICGFQADSKLDLRKVDDVYAFYSMVLCKRLFGCYFFFFQIR
jgi:hypothetical protein